MRLCETARIKTRLAWTCSAQDVTCQRMHRQELIRGLVTEGLEGGDPCRQKLERKRWLIYRGQTRQ